MASRLGGLENTLSDFHCFPNRHPPSLPPLCDIPTHLIADKPVAGDDGLMSCCDYVEHIISVVLKRRQVISVSMESEDIVELQESVFITIL